MVWGLLSLALSPLAGIPFLLLSMVLVYALWFGVRETLGLHHRLLGIIWQVPSSWIRGRSAGVRAIIWGVTLGPGLVTKNPYAGMWLLPLLVALIALNHNPFVTIAVGAASGVAHGGARAIGVLRNRKCIAVDASAHRKILQSQEHWQYLDGLALLLVAGALAAYALFFLGLHF